MNCFEEGVAKFLGVESVPQFRGEDWAQQLQRFLSPLGFRARFVQLDQQAIVSHRLPNGTVHAELMYPTLLTTFERL